MAIVVPRGTCAMWLWMIRRGGGVAFHLVLRSLPLVYVRLSRSLLSLCLILLFASCAKDRVHTIRVSVADQKMAIYRHQDEIARYDVSTSKFGLGDVPGSNATPLGRMEVAKKIGSRAPLGMKFKNRKPTGEIVAVNAPGRDPIVTRILWLKGLEAQNRGAYDRKIYIHGTPEESKVGTPASYGCVRMKSQDVVQLFDTVGEGARVEIFTQPLPAAQPPVVEESVTVAAASGVGS